MRCVRACNPGWSVGTLARREDKQMDALTARRSLTASQIAQLQQLPDAQEFEVPRSKATVEASVYTDEKRYQAEQEAIFKRVPVAIAPSALLPEPNMAVTQQGYDVPILLTRSKDGVAHAFVNVCRHRGSVLCDLVNPERKNRISCPFHAWTYALGGELIGIPQQNSFPGLDKQELGLVALECREAGGIIWVGLNRDRRTDFSSVTGQLADDLDAFGIADMHIYARETFDVKANWKLTMDAFLEGYHILRLHSDSVARFFTDSPSVGQHLGPHLRSFRGRSNFGRSLDTLSPEIVRQTVTFNYMMFPAAALITTPQYSNFMIMQPQAVDRTLVQYFMLTPSVPADEAEEDLYRRSLKLMKRVFGDEDFAAAASCQTGLKTGAIDRTIIGGLEENLRMFHDVIDEHVRSVAPSR